MVLLPTAYLPSLSWCSQFWNANTVTLEAFEHYQKGSIRNRAYIAGPNGVQRLSIPLIKGKHQQTAIREVRIAYDQNWQRQHWRTICTAYGNAAYFEHYIDGLAPFYNQRYNFLFDYNFELINFILRDKLVWKGVLQLSEAFNTTGDKQDNTAKTFYQTPSDIQNTDISFPNPGASATYPQVFQEKHGFIPNLSVLDLLFCCGKYGGEKLKGVAVQND